MPRPRGANTSPMPLSSAPRAPPSLPAPGGASSVQADTPALWQIVLEGHAGKRAEYMGTWTLREVDLNGFPLYTKPGRTDGTLFLYRSSECGRWRGANDEKLFGPDRKLFGRLAGGSIRTVEAADLPTCSIRGEVTWEYEERYVWNDDSAMTCFALGQRPLFSCVPHSTAPSKPDRTMDRMAPRHLMGVLTWLVPGECWG